MMSRLIKNRRGIGFRIIIMIFLLLLSAAVILWVVKSSATKASEKTQIDICRVTNEIRVGTEEHSQIFLWISIHSPRICNTIYNLEVPTEKYSQDIEGAKAEIGDMLKNCWYMWLEGSRKEVFPDNWVWWGGQEGCQVCYVFKVKDKVLEGETLGWGSLENALHNRIYFAADSSDQCSPNIGGFMIPSIPSGNSCEESFVDHTGKDKWRESREWKEVPSKKALAEDAKCCISKEPQNECENKGGMCSESGIIDPYTKIYYKWYCPKAKQRCYVKEGDIYTYFKYLTQYGARGGRIEYEGNIIGTVSNAISIYSRKESINNAWLKESSIEFAKNNGCEIV
jgi:hypothetical protein